MITEYDCVEVTLNNVCVTNLAFYLKPKITELDFLLLNNVQIKQYHE